MTAAIPPRRTDFEDKDRRFYVVAPSSVYLSLQEEAIRRGTDLWTLGGKVLSAWMAAGCPDFSPEGASPCPAPSPSSSVADDQGDAE